MKYTIDDIARYAEGAMEDREQAAFENALAGDAALRDELEKYYDIRSGLRMELQEDPQKDALLQTLDAFKGEYFSPSMRVVSFRRRLIRVLPAAAAVILILLIWAPWKPNLYQKYSMIDMQGITERDGHTDSLKVEAEKAFNARHFADARGMLYQINQAEPDNAMYVFFYGVSLMQVDSLEKSRTLFQETFEGPSIYKNEAAFFMAMSYLKEKDKSAARKWLEKIPSDAGAYEKAQEVLKKMSE